MTTKRGLLFRPALLAISALAIVVPTAAVLAQSATNNGYYPVFTNCGGEDWLCSISAPWGDDRLTTVRSKVASDSTIVSPRYWYNRFRKPSILGQKTQYSLGGNVFISHRGLVDLSDSIAENTLASVRNAAENKIYIVEIDVQASKDKEALALHDETVHRVLGLADNQGGEVKVSQYNAADLIGKSVKIKGANQVSYNSSSYYCGNADKQVMSLEKLVQYMEAPPAGVPSTCPAIKGMTYVWDPKNLQAAKSTVWFSTQSPYKKQFMMKVYPTFYKVAATDTVDNVAKNLATSRADGLTMKVMPVISTVRPALNAIAQQTDPALQEQMMVATVDEAIRITMDWAKYFEVQGAEIPGAWDVHWEEFVIRYREKLREKFETSHNSSVTPHNAKGEIPVISVGYRYADFATRNGQTAYVWEMDGYAKKDLSPVKRRTLGGQYPHYMTGRGWPIEGRPSGIGICHQNRQKGCFITTDFPLQEYGISLHPDVKAPYPNNPQTNVDTSRIPASLRTTTRTADGDGFVVGLTANLAAIFDGLIRRHLEATNPGSGGAPGFIWNADGTCNLCNPDNGDG